MEDRGIAEIYLEKINESQNPAKDLASLYAELFDLPFDERQIPVLGRYCKIYGKLTVFYSLLDLLDLEDLEHDKYQRILSYFCKKKLRERVGSRYENLTPSMNKLIERAEKAKTRPHKVGDPFEQRPLSD